MYLLLLSICSVLFNHGAVLVTASHVKYQEVLHEKPTCLTKKQKDRGFPAHMLLDIMSLPPYKLTDEESITESVRNIINKVPKLKLGSILNVHSYKILDPQGEDEGISLSAFLNDGTQLSVQTWPAFGKVLIDVVGRNIRVNLQEVVLPIIVEEFGGSFYNATYSVIPRAGLVVEDIADPDMLPRCEEDDENKNDCHSEDDEEKDDDEDDDDEEEHDHPVGKGRKLHHMFYPVELMSQHKFKYKVHDVQSPYQHIAIWDHQESNDDYLNQTTRSLFLDGVIQSNVDDEEQYHESLVHPAFVASSTDPKRVLIVGGGEGGTLQQVLQWKSVEHVTMVDLDSEVIATSRQYLSDYSNCTTPDGKSFYSCFEDERLDLYTEDFIAWFAREIGNDVCNTSYKEKKDKLYDIVILDLLDIEELPVGEEWAEHLYSELFFERIGCAMTSLGVVVSNFGEGPTYDSSGPENELTMKWDKEDILDQELTMRKMKHVHAMSKYFIHTRLYDTYIRSFRGVWSFLIGIIPQLPSNSTNIYDERLIKDYFEADQSDVNQRLKNGLIEISYPLSYYDGAIQRGFQYPTVQWSATLCSDEDMRKLCDVYPKHLRDIDEIERVSKHRGEDICVMFDAFMDHILTRTPPITKVCSYELDGHDSMLPHSEHYKTFHSNSTSLYKELKVEEEEKWRTISGFDSDYRTKNILRET